MTPDTAPPPYTPAPCLNRHRFPRNAIAGVNAAIVFCQKALGHTGGHEATRGATAFTWGTTDSVADEVG